MAKSIRSKQKMAQRRKKRESGNYHAADAARVARLSAKLLGKGKGKEGEGEGEGEEVVKDEEGDEEMVEEQEGEDKAGDGKKISTSAPRGSRRDNWRSSKGVKERRGKVAATGLGGGKRPFKPNRRR
ncbi:hypothetical protein BD324DRAFT_638687 [Kockovaella imperatae]|uniref:DUF2423 domain-containing protein n=1 Tax=Kockovaella imperatae TaxID=4999 RepID=A0A1Y1U710_9TREE|nr:hypothetical protein BD324DRAFT_638687 [Kockovaella imperatae]ORX33810.1 hypothetical protein BD324DRAFT_638687 [Kockovaella imperatae]